MSSSQIPSQTTPSQQDFDPFGNNTFSKVNPPTWTEHKPRTHRPELGTHREFSTTPGTPTLHSPDFAAYSTFPNSNSTPTSPVTAFPPFSHSPPFPTKPISIDMLDALSGALRPELKELDAREVEVPEDVLKVLKDSNRVSTNNPVPFDDMSNKEKVIYYCPPRSRNRQNDPLLQDVEFTTYSVVASVCMATGIVATSALWHDYEIICILALAAILAVVALAAFWIVRPYAFGHRVITTHRAAIVIPKKHFFFAPVITECIFQTAFEKLLANELDANSKTRNPFSNLIEVVRSPTDPNVGSVSFFCGTSMTFTKINDLANVENILLELVQYFYAKVQTPTANFETVTQHPLPSTPISYTTMNVKTWIGLIVLLIMAGFLPIASGIISHIDYITAFGIGVCGVWITFAYTYHNYSAIQKQYEIAIVEGRAFMYAFMEHQDEESGAEKV